MLIVSVAITTAPYIRLYRVTKTHRTEVEKDVKISENSKTLSIIKLHLCEKNVSLFWHKVMTLSINFVCLCLQTHSLVVSFTCEFS